MNIEKLFLLLISNAFFGQDDSELNRKMLLRLIESDRESFPDCSIKEADDGVTAIELYKEEASRGCYFDFILMDYIMVSADNVEF